MSRFDLGLVMTKCQYNHVQTCCRCEKCDANLSLAQKLVDRGCDVRDIVPELRPWILHCREERCTARGGPSGGTPGIRDDPGAGPWSENAVGELEDWDDGTPTA